jgi:hypothetical protein
MAEPTQLPQSALQQQIVRMALDLAAQLEQASEQAPVGSVLDACEGLLLDRGRQFLRDSLAATLQRQADQAEKKGGRPAPVPAGRPAATRGPARGSSSPR